jgi:hypothetical protein
MDELSPLFDARYTIAPKALKTKLGGGDLSSGITHPQLAANWRQALYAESAVSLFSTNIKSSMQLTNAISRRRDDTNEHQSGILQKFKGAQEQPNNCAPAIAKQVICFTGSNIARIQKLAWKGFAGA